MARRSSITIALSTSQYLSAESRSLSCLVVTTERLVWVERVPSRIFRGSLQFASGFCSSPLAASPLAARTIFHHVYLCPFVVLISQPQFRHGCDKSVPSHLLFLTVAGVEEVSRAWSLSVYLGRVVGPPISRSISWNSDHSRVNRDTVDANGYFCRLSIRQFDCLVRRAPARPIAHQNARRAAATVGRCLTMPSSSVGPSGAIQRSPAEEQLRAAHRGRAPGVGRAINAFICSIATAA